MSLQRLNDRQTFKRKPLLSFNKFLKNTFRRKRQFHVVFSYVFSNELMAYRISTAHRTIGSLKAVMKPALLSVLSGAWKRFKNECVLLV